MPNKIAETYQVAYQAAITRGLDPLAAKVEALDAVAATPEGAAYIKKVIGELKDIAEGAGKPIKSLTAEEIAAAMAEWDDEPPTDAVDIVSDEAEVEPEMIGDDIIDAIIKGETSSEEVLGLAPEPVAAAPAEEPNFLISEETYQAALANLKAKTSGFHAGIDPTVLKGRTGGGAMRDKLKVVGNILLVILILSAVLVIPVLFIVGAELLSELLLPWLVLASLLAFAFLLLVLFPLAAFRPSRPFASVAMHIVSYVFGATVWMEGLLLTMVLWGTWAVFTGLFFLGVGVVPIAMLATLFQGHWARLAELVVLTVLTFGTRFLALWVSERAGTLPKAEV